MHRLLPIEPAPRSWEPKLSRFWVRVWRPVRRFSLRFAERIHRHEVRGIGHLHDAIARGAGVMVVSNHAAFADQYLLMDAADRVDTAFHFMIAWQVFGTRSRFHHWVLQRHGCFSIDREGTDLGAFKQAVEILSKRSEPLVVFPEGEIYHRSERVTPFRSGAAAIALTAARRSDRPIVIVPCALKYHYTADPTKNLTELTKRIEHARLMPARPDATLRERIYRIADHLLDEKETEHLGTPTQGSLKDRIANLANAILATAESRNGIAKPAETIPERIKVLRALALKRWDENQHGPEIAADLDSAFLATQLFCYPGNYLDEKPTIERLAETIDKLEEDVLGTTFAKPKARRSAVLSIGPPIVVESAARRDAAEALTRRLETEIQSLLDGIEPPYRPWSHVP